MQECIEYVQDLKYNQGYGWLLKIPEAITKQAIKDLDKSYKKFFKGQGGYPKFKSKKHSKISFYQRTDNLRQIDETHIKITGIKGAVKCDRFVLPKKVQNPRISYDGKYWYLSFSYEVEVPELEHTDEVIGVDLGIKELAVCSNGYVAENINYTTRVKKIERRKKRLQRKIANKYEIHKQGKKYIKTNNIKKLEKQVALLDRKLRNIRDTYIHQTTYDLVKTKPKRICIEDLNVSGLMKNKYLAKSIQEQEWSKFRQYLTYKCDFYGIELVVADRKYASSQICHKCGYKNPKVRNLSVRNWVCPQCMVRHDRDYNASLNLMQYAM